MQTFCFVCYPCLCHTLAYYVSFQHAVSTARVKKQQQQQQARCGAAFCGQDTQPGNPETQSVSNAGRRSANKGPRLFLTVAYFNTGGGSPRPPDVYVLVVTLSPALISCCVRLLSPLLLLHFPCLAPLPGAAMTGVQGKAPVG